MATDTRDKIELRSERARRLTDELPTRLLRVGMALTVGILLALIAAVVFIRYPYGDGESVLVHLMAF